LGAFLLILLLVSFGVACLLLASRTRRYRRRLTGPGTVRTLGVAQLLVGVLWCLWGALYLGAHGSASAGGWYAVAIGLLWAVQALRRMAALRRR
jgi:hypothetical protein